MKTTMDVYNIDGFTSEIGADSDAIAELFKSYIDEMREESANMLKLLSERNWAMLERVVHNIKGVSANLNIYDVLAESEKFDKLLKSSSIENPDEYVDRIISLLQAAEDNIRSYFIKKGISL